MAGPDAQTLELAGREVRITSPDKVLFGERGETKPDFSALTFTINNSEFHYGAFINSLISFLIIALVVFFLIIKPMNALMPKVATPAVEAEPALCPECFSRISPDANRCPNCTTWLRGPNAPVS